MSQSPVFLGDDLLTWLVLAFGAAMLVGNALALLRPPATPEHDANGDADHPLPARPPVARTLVMAAVGLVATVWALATLVT